MKIQDAREFMSGDDWTSSCCQRCGRSLSEGVATRPVRSVPDEVDLVCVDCAHDHDRTDFLRDGVLRCGSSLDSIARMRRDREVSEPHAEAAIVLVPTLQELHRRYRHHLDQNASRVKGAVFANLSTGAVMLPGWGKSNEAIASTVPGTPYVTICEVMCGYVAIDLGIAHDERGMWVQGQVRPGAGEEAWLRSCWASRAFIDEVNAAARSRLDWSAATWRALEATTRIRFARHV